jgi:hypothetical protein
MKRDPEPGRKPEIVPSDYTRPEKSDLIRVPPWKIQGKGVKFEETFS